MDGSPRKSKRDGQQMALTLRDPGSSNEPPKVALYIPPPRSPDSSIRRLVLAAEWATRLGELTADLVTEGKLVFEQVRTPGPGQERA